MRLILLFVLCFILSNFLVIPQQDTLKEKPTQFRREIELQEGYQSYEEKYAGKNLNEEKRRLFPLRDGTGVWTELNPRIPRVTYLGVHFINDNTGWAVGDLGAIIKTTNGGEDWTLSESNTTTLLLKISSFDGQTVIATGYDGMILRSTDEGGSFEQVQSGVGSGIDLWGVQMLNDTVGFACGLNQTLLKTTDAGLNWQTVTTGFNYHYWAIDFYNEQYGMIACSSGKILKTKDGGLSWTEHQAGDESDLFAIDIINNTNIAATGASGKNVYSSDGGITWIQNNRLQHDELNSIKFIDTETGYTIGTYGGDSWGIRKTTNRGATWFSPTSPNLCEWELELLPGGTGYAVGSDLWITKTTGGFDNWKGLFLNANFVDVFFTDELTGYAADGRYTGGPLYKTTNGGVNWFALPNFPSSVFTSSLSSIFFTDSLTGFAGSAPARIVKTTNAGESWYIANRTGLTDTIGLINRFFFINKNIGWAVTTRGGILKTTDAGENWFAQLNAGVSVIFQSIYFVDSLYGWTANISQWPYKTTNGGDTWVQQTNLNIFSTRDIVFIDSLIGFTVKSNELYKTSNSGKNWILIPNVTGFSIAARLSYSSDIIFITGFTNYRSINSGEDWEEFAELNGVRINGLSLLGAGSGYAVGELGLVLKYLDTSYVPVELISFQGTVKNGKVILTWLTASELNNREFQIEKSVNKEKWLNIGFVEGKGTSAEQNIYSFVDELSHNQFHNIYYRLKQIDYDGSFEYSKWLMINVLIPESFELYQNFPNPFNPYTKIKWQSPISGIQILKVYDILGRELKTLLYEYREAGRYEIDFDASVLSSGIYFYKLNIGGYTQIRKMILLR